MRLPSITGVALTIAGLSTGLLACSADGGRTSTTPARDATFVMTVDTDPGSLDPHLQTLTAQSVVDRFAYDTLVTELHGKIVPQLAATWTEKGTALSLTLRPGITCSDGAPLTATDVAANITFIGDVKNRSALAGYAIPIGTTATADDAQRTVVVRTPTPTGFRLNNLALVPIVCASGLADRASLVGSTAGTGPYRLTKAASGDRYALERRDDYAWGPDGQTTKSAGIPKHVEIRVVTNETTVANLVLSGDVNAGLVRGDDAARLTAAKLQSRSMPAIIGEVVFNQNTGRATNDPKVREALAQALDFTALRRVIGAGRATDPAGLTGLNLCRASAATPQIPTHDVSAARAVLTERSLPQLKVVYPSTFGASGTAAAELVVDQLAAVGVRAKAHALSPSDLSVFMESADFDISLVPFDAYTPASASAFFHGPGVAEGGRNFANIHNPDYDRAAASAISMIGTSGCAQWNEGEAALVSSADVIPFAVGQYPIWAKGASFEAFGGMVQPTTIRMRR